MGCVNMGWVLRGMCVCGVSKDGLGVARDLWVWGE